jgi:hypothetical protein
MGMEPIYTSLDDRKKLAAKPIREDGEYIYHYLLF